MDHVRLGIVGLGNMGSGHISSMPKLNRTKLTAICDLVPEKLERYSGVSKFTSSAEMIRSGEIDAILIAAPHYDHTLIGIDALGQGIHVLTEKPLSVHKADCERLIAAYENAPGTVFAAMFNQRTDPHYQQLRKLVQSGELGELRRVNWLITDWFRTDTYYASGGWRATWRGEGGGVLLNQCPHNLDLLQWIVGMPNKIRAFCQFGKWHDIEVEDAVTAYLEYPNGATGVFVTTTGEAPGTNRLEIAGDRGKVVYESGVITFHRTVSSVQEFNQTSKESFPTVETWRCEIPAKGYGGQHVEIIQNFVDAILDGKPLIAPAPEGINSVELANAMLYSTFTDSTVSLPIDSAAYEAVLQEKIATSRYEKPAVIEAVVEMDKSFR